VQAQELTVSVYLVTQIMQILVVANVMYRDAGTQWISRAGMVVVGQF
jgi:hypothetical protein